MPRLLLLFEQQLLVCQSASAAHTALPSARRKASKTTGGSLDRAQLLVDRHRHRALPVSGSPAANWV